MDGRNRDLDLEHLLEHTTWLGGLARSLVSDPNQAEDLVQETWLAAIERPPREARTAGSWLGRVLRNCARLRRRSDTNRRRREVRAARPERMPASPSEVLERAELQQRVAQLVLELPEPCRTAVLLRFYEGLTPKEIALEQEVPVATVRSRLAAGLERLRSRLDHEHRGGREAWRLALLPIAGLAAAGGRTTIACAAAASPAAPAAAAGSTLVTLAGGAMTVKTIIIAGAAGVALLAAGLRLGAHRSAGTAGDAAIASLERRHQQDLARIDRLEAEVAAGRRRLENALRASLLPEPPGPQAAAPAAPVETAALDAAPGTDEEVHQLLADLDKPQMKPLTTDEIEATLAKHDREPDYLVAAALLTDDPEAARAYIEEALEKDPDSPGALLALLNLQLRQGESGDEVAATIARLSEVDPANALPRAFSAYLKLGRGDFEGTLADLREAALRPRLNDYDGKHYPLHAEFYADAGHTPAASRLLASMGTRMEELLVLRDLAAGACDRATALLASGDRTGALAFTEAAADLGTKLSSAGRSLLQEAVGIAMETRALEREKVIWEAQGDMERLAQIEMKLAAVRERRERYKLMAGNCVPALQELSEAEISRYFDRLNSEGEAAAVLDLPLVREAVRAARE